MMASSDGFIEFVCAQLQGSGDVMPRKMFGDWCIYVDGKPVLLVCDEICYVKMHPAIEPLMADQETGSPYPGARPHYILDIGHRTEALKVVRILTEVLPYPKARQSVKKKEPGM